MTTRGDILELTITHLAGLGDGVAEHGGVPVFVPQTCAGDHIHAEVEQVGKDHIRARLHTVLTPAPSRQTPPCPHFSACGGCSLQQLDAAHYQQFMQAIAADVIAQLDAAETALQPLFSVPPHARRRAEYKIAVQKGEVSLGFLGARSHTVVDAPDCKVVDAAIAKAAADWRALLADFKKPSALKALHFTHVNNGLDVALLADGKLKAGDMEKLKAFAAACDYARLALHMPDAPPQWLKAGDALLQWGDVQVALPPMPFLQATQASEAVMVAEVLRHCKRAERIADLYSGCGTFSLPLAQAGHRVHAYEGAQEAITALFNAARSHGRDDRLFTDARDLFAKPLKAEELRDYDAVVINPPRNGALPQTREIAAAQVPAVVMVSCNPATFIRDGKALREQGYTLTHLLPVDQFLWSHHLELVGLFRCNAQ